MVAYNFRSCFVPLIQAGLKQQTIRAPRRRHAQPSEAIQLYTGMRTKSCFKLIAPDPTCLSVEPIVLRCAYAHELGSFKVEIDERLLDPEEIIALAIADGFQSNDSNHPEWFAMMQFFQQTHGLPFQGVLIKWQPQPCFSTAQ